MSVPDPHAPHPLAISCATTRQAWEAILTTEPLKTNFVLGDLISAQILGFPLPNAGHEAECVPDIMKDSEKTAAAGTRT